MFENELDWIWNWTYLHINRLNAKMHYMIRYRRFFFGCRTNSTWHLRYFGFRVYEEIQAENYFKQGASRSELILSGSVWGENTPWMGCQSSTPYAHTQTRKKKSPLNHSQVCFFFFGKSSGSKQRPWSCDAAMLPAVPLFCPSTKTQYIIKI